jgi:hypothetical protein
MKQNELARAVARAVCITGALGLAAAGHAATTQDATAKNGLSHPDALNMVLLGHNDMQNRPLYQPTVHKYPTSVQNGFAGKTLLFSGTHSANNTPNGACPARTLPNPLNGGACERDGTLIVDASNPTHPEVIKHLPPATNATLAQMVRVCDGQDGKLGQTGHVYMLRNDGGTQHEVYDVTDPINPVLLSVVSGFTSTHKNWWECDTGFAWLVAGAGASSPNPDGWTTNQHVKLYDLSDPTNPRYIRDIGLVGQNPGSSVTTLTTGIHGPIVALANPKTGEFINRAYMPYGTEANGVIQIVDRAKVLPQGYRTVAGQTGQLVSGTWDGLGTDRAQHPTDDDLRSLVVGSMDMTPSEGGHSACPVYGIPLRHFQGFKNYTTRDYVIAVSEETDLMCTGAPHNAFMVDATRAIVDEEENPTSGEQHPMAVSTMQVFEDSAKPDYCTRGTRFGPHSCNEVLAHVPSTFNPQDWGKLTFISWFDGGARAFDIRDPYHPKDVAHYVPAVTPLPFGEQPPSVVGGVARPDVSVNNLEVDSNGIIYAVDRIGYGLNVLMLTGPAAAIRNSPQ